MNMQEFETLSSISIEVREDDNDVGRWGSEARAQVA